MGSSTFMGMSSPVDTVTAHPVLAGCARLNGVLDELLGDTAPESSGHVAGVALWSTTDAELTDLVRATDALAARVVGLQARAVAECARRDFPARSAATGGTAWLAGVLTARPARAKTVWRTACQLATDASATQAALCAGTIDPDQAEVIARAVAA